MSERCKERIWDKWSFSGRRCSRSVWKDGYCKQHHPDTVAARKAKRESRWEAQRAEDLRRLMHARLKANALDALRLIAQGHNDPIGLARKTFADAGMHWDED